MRPVRTGDVRHGLRTGDRRSRVNFYEITSKNTSVAFVSLPGRLFFDFDVFPTVLRLSVFLWRRADKRPAKFQVIAVAGRM